MIRVRDDDILMYKGEWKDPYTRFCEIHDLIIHFNGVVHVPAILMTEILDFPEAIEFIKEETDIGRMEPQWHGWKHIDYKDVRYDQICWDIVKSQILFVKWFGVRFTKFYTPWGASEDHIRQACEDHGIEMVDCSDMIRCVHINEEPEKFIGKDIEILIHWWEGKERLNRALKKLT